MSQIYIIGHKSPDLDSVAAAISYANYKNTTDKDNEYIPAVLGELNRETKYILDKYMIDNPVMIEDVKDRSIILVDHNEAIQSADGIKDAKIIEILDHHKVDFSYGEPIVFKILPWGASCSIIANDYFLNGIDIDKNMAALMLSAILVDTVITKSPTCTDYDINIIKKLSKIAQIENWQEFGMEIFKVRSSVSELSVEEIIKSDFKDFDLKAGKFGIGQVETVDLKEIELKEEEIINEMDKMREVQGYHSVILFLTDIINVGSKFLVSSSDLVGIEKALEKKIENNKVYIEGVISRKKQVAPKILEVFNR